MTVIKVLSVSKLVWQINIAYWHNLWHDTVCLLTCHGITILPVYWHNSWHDNTVCKMIHQNQWHISMIAWLLLQLLWHDALTVLYDRTVCAYLGGETLVSSAGQEVLDHISMSLLGGHIKGSKSNLQNTREKIHTKSTLCRRKLLQAFNYKWNLHAY